jgi:16S rRNA (cytosine1402-N4)-methyltransferase
MMAAAPDAPPPVHVPVLLEEAVQALTATRREGLFVDGTFGRGGHARALLARLAPSARLVAFDRDPAAVASAREGSGRITDPRFTIVHAGFETMGAQLASLGLPTEASLAGLLLDLGISSPQIDTPERGFSFRFDAPLDMRMDPTRGETAADFLARASEREIADVVHEHGEERFARAIAKALVARRDAGAPVGRTGELAALVARVVKSREPGQDPATRTFQALRIHVNRELDALREALDAAPGLLATGGRLAVISFHSLEDRLVKSFVARESRPEVDRRAPFVEPPPPRFAAVARVKPGAAEVAANPRSRSAILRVAERTAVGRAA